MPQRPLRSVRVSLLAVFLLCTAPINLPALPVRAAGATWTVTDLGDSGPSACGQAGQPCQLRDALGKAANGDTIAFTVTGTITLMNDTQHGALTVGTNVAIQGPKSGAGVAVDGGGAVPVVVVRTGIAASISNLTIANGHASGDGGGISNNGTLTLTNSTVSGNSAGGRGGGISNGGTLTLTNSTVSGDTTGGGDGGGIYNANGSTLTVTNSTLADNHAAGNGGGIANQGTLHLTNTVIARNDALTDGLEVAGAVMSGGHNLIPVTDGSSGWTGTDITGTFDNPLNPLLGPLANYGGPTQTIPLFSGSPALGAGDTAACAATGAGAVGGLDQRGLPRPAATCAVGAFEPQRATYTVGTATNTGGLATFAACQDATNTSCQLRDALLYASSGRDTITFGMTGTIAVVNTLKLTTNVTVTGPTSGPGVTMDGGGNVGVVEVRPGITASISNLTIANGHAPLSIGGAILNYGTLTVTNSTLSGNTGVLGGAIYNYGTLTLANSTLSGNSASQLHGGGIANGGTLTVTNSTFTGNSAVGFGGGIANFLGSSLTVTNSTLTSNSASSGGGISNQGAPATILNSIVSGNSSGDVGGSATTNHDLIGGTPLLAALGAYGGTTRTMPPLPGSPAIDMGDDATCAATGPGHVNGVDQRGVSRSAHGAHCDIGAVESQGFGLGMLSGNNQTAAVNATFAPLAAIIGSAFGEPVAGGQMTFTGPASGAGIQLGPFTVTIGASGIVSTTPAANGSAGGYSVIASAAGATPVAFSLANTPVLSGISPSSGSTAGGNKAVLTGVGFGTAPANVQVRVSGTAIPAGSIVSVTETQIVYVAPAHASGDAGVGVSVNGVAADASMGYTYGVVGGLPTPQPPGGPGGGSPAPVPGTRPAGSPAGGNVGPMPPPRP